MLDESNLSQLLTEYLPILERCPVFNGLTKPELRSMIQFMQLENFPAATEILTEGKTYQGLWVLLRGRVEVVKRGQNNDSKLAVLDQGSVFGEMSFLRAEPHSATVKAIEEVKTIRILHGDFQTLSNQCPNATLTLVSNLVGILSDRLRKMDEWNCELVERNADVGKTEWQEFRTKLFSKAFE